jgi:hypothetical protein
MHSTPQDGVEQEFVRADRLRALWTPGIQESPPALAEIGLDDGRANTNVRAPMLAGGARASSRVRR